ncbi:copper homeostasis protein CutC [Gleimia coleocanis]|nr:copper homeostasis protein CutC [Gleimia coleocanis]
MMTVIEVCVEDLAGIQAAYEGGADRVELCVNLEVGGLTAPDQLIFDAIEMISGFEREFSLRLLIREYYESFIHNSEQQRDLVISVARLRKLLEKKTTFPIGFVVGALDADGTVPEKFLDEMVTAVDGWSVVFHRGIDASSARNDGLAKLVAHGFTGVLTTGGDESVADVVQLADDILQHGSTLQIIASGGVRAHNAAGILRESGAPEIHFRAPYEDGRPGTDPERVAQIVKVIREA